eukprot:TRINITY_DN11939_c0_g1_i1.p1 TRINITY_DN11939_c0_g1~~TRINITY_DN11939_c0_g1_i1.p1  ORF type:complete len:1247 (+),score=49.55 TRINITY_DN11939_c0_g1_i1:91-3831(+)
MCKPITAGTCATSGWLLVYTASECQRLSKDSCNGPTSLTAAHSRSDRPPGCYLEVSTNKLYMNTNQHSTVACSPDYECYCCDPSQNSGSDRCETLSPSTAPTGVPSLGPSTAPTGAPSAVPSPLPSLSPSRTTTAPTLHPTVPPTIAPSVAPSTPPTVPPTFLPSSPPSTAPTVPPTTSPTLDPSVVPTVPPSPVPTAAPVGAPTAPPSRAPSALPSAAPTASPSIAPATPTNSPILAPSVSPHKTPTLSPSAPPAPPSASRSISPTTPTASAAFAPTGPPTAAPIWGLIAAPSRAPTAPPSGAPIPPPSVPPMTPTASPIVAPTLSPPTLLPSASPAAPSAVPTAQPLFLPTASPSLPPAAPAVPSRAPSVSPAGASIAVPPNVSATVSPGGLTASPSWAPTVPPIVAPTVLPHQISAPVPSTSPVAPSAEPTARPRFPPATPPSTPLTAPSAPPSRVPTVSPMDMNSVSPSLPPTAQGVAPSGNPRLPPTAVPSMSPVLSARLPSRAPSTSPAERQIQSPTATPSTGPTASPRQRTAPLPGSAQAPTALPTRDPAPHSGPSPSVAPQRQPRAPASPPARGTPPSLRTPTPHWEPTTLPHTSPTAPPSAAPSPPSLWPDPGSERRPPPPWPSTSPVLHSPEALAGRVPLVHYPPFSGGTTLVVVMRHCNGPEDAAPEEGEELAPVYNPLLLELGSDAWGAYNGALLGNVLLLSGALLSCTFLAAFLYVAVRRRTGKVPPVYAVLEVARFGWVAVPLVAFYPTGATVAATVSAYGDDGSYRAFAGVVLLLQATLPLALLRTVRKACRQARYAALPRDDKCIRCPAGGVALTGTAAWQPVTDPSQFRLKQQLFTSYTNKCATAMAFDLWWVLVLAAVQAARPQSSSGCRTQSGAVIALVLLRALFVTIRRIYISPLDNAVDIAVTWLELATKLLMTFSGQDSPAAQFLASAVSYVLVFHLFVSCWIFAVGEHLHWKKALGVEATELGRFVLFWFFFCGVVDVAEAACQERVEGSEIEGARDVLSAPQDQDLLCQTLYTSALVNTPIVPVVKPLGGGRAHRSRRRLTAAGLMPAGAELAAERTKVDSLMATRTPHRRTRVMTQTDFAASPMIIRSPTVPPSRARLAGRGGGTEVGSPGGTQGSYFDVPGITSPTLERSSSPCSAGSSALGSSGRHWPRGKNTPLMLGGSPRRRCPTLTAPGRSKGMGSPRRRGGEHRQPLTPQLPKSSALGLSGRHQRHRPQDLTLLQ